MNIAVFVGPSLSKETCQKILDAEYYPPIKRGDLSQLPKHIDIVAIIDGVMLNSSAVGHREILSILHAGISVFGGGSMGALRAAELESFGMRGIGRIYEEYLSERIIGDDEVVLSYDPFSLEPLSEPLINFRLNLEIAVDKQIITRNVAERIIHDLKETFYPKRNQSRLREIVQSILPLDEYVQFCSYWKSNYCDFKRADAELVLKTIASSAKNLHS